MSEGAWSPQPWEEGPDRPARLPHVGDLPSVEGGYRKDAVESAFAAFHEHAARLDRTLEVLEAVAAFEQRAGELRADIRALRAAAWGPLPIPRSSWGAAYAARTAARGGPVPAALPRLAVEAAFIILVAVGAALAEVETPILVGLVLAAWVIVGLIEVLVAASRAQRRVPAVPPVAAGPLFVPAPRPPFVGEDTQEEAVIFEPAPELEAALEYEPELAALDDDGEDEGEEELPPAAVAAEGGAVDDPWADSADEEGEVEPPHVDVPEEEEEEETGEQPALVSLVPEPEAAPEQSRGRFWRRKEAHAEPVEPESGERGDAKDDAGDDLLETRSSELRRGRR